MKTKILLLIIPFLFTSNIESGQYKGRATIELPKRLCTKENRPKRKKFAFECYKRGKRNRMEQLY